MICSSSKYNRHEKQEGENERMNDNFNNDKWTEKAVWIKKEPLSSDAVLSEVRALLDMLNGEDVIIMQSTALRQGEFEGLLKKVSEHFR